MKNLFKKATALFLAVSMVFTSAVFVFAQEPQPQEYLSLRNTVESIGGTAEWDYENAVIIVNYEGSTFIFQLGSNNVYVDGVAQTLTSYIGVNNDRAYISAVDAARLFVPANYEVEAGEFDTTIATTAEVVTHFMDQFSIPGVTVALVDAETGFTWTQGFGYADTINNIPVDENTVFQLASTSKPITAVAVMQLVEQGLIDLDTPIVNYLPEFSQLSSPLHDGNYANITTRMLLTHTSGVLANFIGYGAYTYDTHSPDFLNNLLDLLAQNYMMVQEDYAFVYNNNGFNLLGILVAAVTGDDNFFDDFVSYTRDNIFVPAGMARSSFKLTYELVPYLARPYTDANTPATLHVWNGLPTAGVVSTAYDMARFMNFILGGGAFEDTRILSQESITQMITRHDFDFSLAPASMGYGLGFMNSIGMDGVRVIGHGGNIAHYQTGMDFDFNSGIGVFVSTNSSTALPVIAVMTQIILQTAVMEKTGIIDIVLPVVADPEATPIEVELEELYALQGLYVGSTEYYVLTVEDGVLYFNVPGVAEFEPMTLTPMSDGSFATVVGGRFWFVEVEGIMIMRAGDFAYHTIAARAEEKESFIADEEFIATMVGTFEARPAQGEVATIPYMIFGVDSFGIATLQSINLHGLNPTLPLPIGEADWDTGTEDYELDDDGVVVSFRMLGMDFVRVD